jgi:hypothetical protein
MNKNKYHDTGNGTHAHNDNWGITSILIDQNAYDREMKTHLHGYQGQNYKI